MNIIFKNLVYILLVVSCILSCSDGKKEATISKEVVQQPINPNGDSELALLMREMFDEAQLIKEQIANGEPLRPT